MRKLSLILLLSNLYGFVSDIIPYHDHLVFPARPEYLVIPKYDKGDVPHWSPGHGHSYIDLSQLTLQVDCSKSDFPDCETRSKQSPVNFELFMFEMPADKTFSDYWPDDAYCCNTDEIDEDQCLDDDIGKLIIPPSLAGLSQSFSVTADQIKDLNEMTAILHHDISKSGEYVFIMAVCDERAAGPVSVAGHIESLDPYGFLPANLFGDLPFYGALSVMYSMLSVVWMISCTLYVDQLIPLHFWISTVLGLGMLETTFLFGGYLHWNDMGSHSVSMTTFAALFGVMKRALSRVVVQFIALGFGIVRPSLGEDYNRVIFLGGSYLMLSLVYSIVSMLPRKNRPMESQTDVDLMSIIVLVLAGIDTTFYIWIFTSIQNLIQTLAARKQGAKYILYRNFRSVLFVSVFFTAVWALYRSIVMYGDKLSTWELQWTVDALWELMYFAVFVSIAFLWAPSKNSLRYAYSIELTQLDDDEEYNQTDALKKSEETGNDDSVLDDEYGGKLQDDNDPFLGTGALDTAMAISKKA